MIFLKNNNNFQFYNDLKFKIEFKKINKDLKFIFHLKCSEGKALLKRHLRKLVTLSFPEQHC